MNTFEENRERILSKYEIGSIEWFAHFRYYYDEYKCESKEEYINTIRKLLSAIRDTAAECPVKNTQIKFNDGEVEDFYALFDKLKDNSFSDGFNDYSAQIYLMQKELFWLFKFDIWVSEEDIIIHYAIDMVGENKEALVYCDGRYSRHYQSYYFDIAKPYPFIRSKTAVEYFDYIQKEHPKLDCYIVATIREVSFNGYIGRIKRHDVFTISKFFAQSADVITFLTRHEWEKFSQDISDLLPDMHYFAFTNRKEAYDACVQMDKEKETLLVDCEDRIKIK